MPARSAVLLLSLPLALPLASCASAADAGAAPGGAGPAAVHAQGLLSYDASPGPGGGRHVVLIAGDEEYRSEEALPQLARILSRRHGFACTVLFATNPADGSIDPTASGHIPGLQALDDADLLILFTRFRRLPDADMAHVADYVVSGRPILGLRTATHAFAYESGSTSPYATWSWDAGPGAAWPGGFGQHVFGETWVAHHGDHGRESTRGVIPDAVKDQPVLRGVLDVWGPTDVYAVRPLPPDATVLLEGAVLSGMTPDSAPVTDARNAPRMPIAWTREIRLPGGGTQRTACSTIGAAVDLRCEDLRRLLVNLCYWATGLAAEIPGRADVDLVGTYEPTMFGFGGWRHGVHPLDLALAPAR